MKLSEIAQRLGGKLVGEDIEIKGVASISDAKEGDITFSLDENEIKTHASSIILKKVNKSLNIPIILLDNPKLGFCKLLGMFINEKHPCKTISKMASISPNAEIGKDVAICDFAVISDGAKIDDSVIIYPFVYIGEDVEIGRNTIIYPRAVLMHAKIGNNVIIHSGCVIGSDGFGYIEENGKHIKIPHKGGVIIGDDVEIGANTTIDRATTGNTIIQDGTKIDNLVQIGHNCIIGKNCIIVACVGIGGSVVIEDNVVIGGQAGIHEHVKIGKDVKIAAKSGVTKDIPSGKIVSGFPAKEHNKEKRIYALIQRLPDLVERVKRLENR